MEILNENGKTYLKGIMTEANFGKNPQGYDFSFRGRNRNGRLYPYNILEKATLDLKEKVDKGGVFSYLGHPPHSDLIESDSAGKIIELEWIPESGRAICKVEILEYTKDGKEILKAISEGKTFGISTRGLGSLDENKAVKEGLVFVTSDIIKNYDGEIQSCQSCTLSLTESIQANYNDYLIQEDKKPCGCIYATLDNKDKKLAENYLIEAFKSCLKSF